MAALGNLVTLGNYSAIRNLVTSIMGTGSGSYGYGQLAFSPAKSITDLVSQSDWDLLKYDLVNALTHQSGSAGTITDINEHQLVSAASTSTYEDRVGVASVNRFLVSNGYFLTTTTDSNGVLIQQSRTWSGGASWRTEINCELTVTFPTANDARYFFNSGGEIRVQSTRSATTLNNSQNTAWTNLLNSAGTAAFKGQYYYYPPGYIGTQLTGPDFYNMTTSYQTFYTLSSSSPYASNTYILEAKCDVNNITQGNARIVTIRIRFVDGYNDPGSPAPGDAVDGVFTISVTEKRATGTILVPPGVSVPSSAFSIVRPTYSFGAIIGS